MIFLRLSLLRQDKENKKRLKRLIATFRINYQKKMKKISFIICTFFLSICLSAQENELITVKAGTKILNYFPIKTRYRYPDFSDGQLMFKNGKVNSGRFNYNILTGEMEFLQSRDTLSIIDKKDIRFLVIAQDTFFYDNGYIEVISGGPVKVGLMQNIKLKEIQRKGAFGTTNRNSSIDAYNSMSLTGNFYELIPNEDWVFQKTEKYFISASANGFVQFSKKNVIEAFPQKEDAVKAYLKSNKVDFNSRKDLFRLADYLRSILSKSP
jgi:hypothetical protein